MRGDLTIMDALNSLERSSLLEFLLSFDFVVKASEEESAEVLSKLNADRALFFRVEFNSLDDFVEMEDELFEFYNELLDLVDGKVWLLIDGEIISGVLDASDFVFYVATNSYLRIDGWVPFA